MFRIRKMANNAGDYFRYFPISPDAEAWGVAVTGAGRTTIPAGTPYPPKRHPADHDLEWTRGRVLEAVQIVLITAGGGYLETSATKPRALRTGSAFMLFPGVWHRYRPDPSVGWDESWVELQGTTVDKLLHSGVFRPEQPVLAGALAAGLETRLQAVHAQARHHEPGFDAELAVRGLEVLAAWYAGARLPRRQSRLARAVGLAELHFAEHLADPVNVAQLARRLGVAYSHFRKAFRQHTGFAPWQYVVNLRLSHARRILAATDHTLESVATAVGFSSAFHFSASFKQAFGVSPSRWRRRFGTTAGQDLSSSDTE